MVETATNLNDPDPFEDLISGFPCPAPARPVKPQKPELYLPSKLPWFWLTKADSLGGSALAVGLMIHHRRGISKVTGSRNKIGLTSCDEIGLGKFAVRKSLDRLIEAKLIEVDSGIGRKSVVRILDYPPGISSESVCISQRIPYDWICKATMVPTPGLIVGLAAWRFERMTVEEGRSEFKIDPLHGSTRTHASLRFGLNALQKAGLIELLPSLPGYAHMRIIHGNVRKT